jgi:hypothetical protein
MAGPQLTSGPFGSSTKLLEFEDVREDDEEVREDDDDDPDDHSILEDTRTSRASCPPWASQQAEGVTPMIEPTVTAGISQRGRVQAMSKKMAESTSQKNFFGTSGMHYMANKLITAFDETAEDLFHNQLRYPGTHEKPCSIPCQDDGRYYVFPASYEPAR